MARSTLLLAATLCLFVGLVASPRPAYADAALPRQLEGTEIEDRVGEQIPADVELHDHEGRPVTTADYLDGKRPLIVVMSYYECPMLCSLVLNGLTKGMAEAEGKPGEDYRVLVVSFDARDTVGAAAKKRESYLAAYGGEVGKRGFDFAIGEAGEVRRLADALGFNYRWDDEQKQFAHAAGVFVVSPEGTLTTTLPGITFPEPALGAALSNARLGVTTHSPLKQMLLFCFQYDAQAGSWVVAGMRLMRVGGAVTVALILYLLFRLFRRERRLARGRDSESTYSESRSQDISRSRDTKTPVTTS